MLNSSSPDETPGQKTGFVLTRNWRDTSRGVELEFWLCTQTGPQRLLVPAQEVLFFFRSTQLDDLRDCLGTDFRYRHSGLEMCDFGGHKVSACYFRSQRALRQARDRLQQADIEVFEADVNPCERFLMERFIAGSLSWTGAGAALEVRRAQWRPRLKMVSLDIETAMQGVELYSIGLYAECGGVIERRVFLRGGDCDLDFVQACVDERQLLEALFSWLEEWDPDVIIGWNVINFDLWYLQRVADKLSMRLRLGRGGSVPHWRELDDDGERKAVNIPGRTVLDGIETLRTATYRFERFSLEYVSRQLLDDGKLLHGDDRGGQIGQLFVEDKAALARYNLHDCKLVWDIFALTGLLDFAIERSRMTGLNMDRPGGSVAAFDYLYLPRLHRAGHVAPNASSDVTASPGGFVLDSRPGIYDHVLVLDFKSLYPSIIRTFCIDPLGLALAAFGELDEAETVPGFPAARFARQGHILPALIQQLWQERDEAKRVANAPLSQAVKILMNSFYGVLGTPGCRFFDTRLASSVTRRGHQILQRTREFIEAAGHAVIYGDTDSVFVWVHEARSDEDALAAGRALQGDINRWWLQEINREFGLESLLELEFETHYKKFLMPTVRGSDRGSKKRYAGVVASPDGDQLVFKGLESVRTDWTRLARDFQEELYRRVFMDEPYADYVRLINGQVLGGEHDEDLVYRKRLRRRLDDYQRNVPPHVRAARLCQERGLAVPTRGNSVAYVMTTSGPEPAEKPLAPLDYEYYVERQLLPVADGILCFLGTSYSALVGKQIDLF